MFGTNALRGKSFFKEAPSESLLVTSMFYTLQGEGPYAGQPALFIRLTGCNLTCSFCDTFFDEGEWMTYEEIENKAYHIICDFWNNRGLPVPLWAMPTMTRKGEQGETILGPYKGIVLVITGGEPLLQANLNAFLVRQRHSYKAIQIESNGILDTETPANVTLVCSPKCAERDGKPTQYLKPSQTILTRADYLKFVLSADPDSPYHTIPDWAHQWEINLFDKDIYVSPMNVYNDVPQQAKILRLTKKDGKLSMDERSTVDEVISFWTPGLLNPEQNQKNHEYAAHYALEHGFKLNLQLHLYASLA